jgi:hypothetical protein
MNNKNKITENKSNQKESQNTQKTVNNEKTQNNENQITYKSFKKFKKIKLKGPVKIFSNILSTFSKKNAFHSPSFWFRNVIFFFLTFKLIQFYRYAREFNVTLTKEEAQSDLIYLNSNSIKSMNQQALFEYLDKLELEKEKRKINKINNLENSESSNI